MLDQLVEVKRGERARDADRPGGLIPPDLAAPTGDVEIKPPPHGVIEGRNRGDLALELCRSHATNLHRL